MGTVNLPKQGAMQGGAPVQGEFETQVLAQSVEEETGAVLRYLADKQSAGKLSAEAQKRLGKGSLKEKLYHSIDRQHRDMFARYVAFETSSEELVLPRKKSGEIANLLHSIGGANQFNTGELERSADHVNDLEYITNNMLRQETASSLYMDNAYSVVKCVFRNNAYKPSTVTDVKLAIIIPDSEIIGTALYHYAVSKYLLKEISGHLIKTIDREIDNPQLMDILTEGGTVTVNPSSIREIIRKSTELERVRTQKFNIAINTLVSILDQMHMSYQFFENSRNGRELIVREYEDSDLQFADLQSVDVSSADLPSDADYLPDERFQIQLKYFDREQLAEARADYDTRIKIFENAVQHLWYMVEVLYQDSKSVFKVNDFEDLAKKCKSRIKALVKDKTQKDLYETGTAKTGAGKTDIRTQLVKMHERIRNMYEFLYPVERRIVEERLALLEKEYSCVDRLINPHHLQPGLLIEIDITSIKRRKITLNAIAEVLLKFLPRTNTNQHE
ncbi:MAG: hypothetical protein FWD36_08025 [Treponema sp.]|nr:hypothetical protein [Treponema sp.]